MASSHNYFAFNRTALKRRSGNLTSALCHWNVVLGKWRGGRPSGAMTTGGRFPLRASAASHRLATRRQHCAAHRARGASCGCLPLVNSALPVTDEGGTWQSLFHFSLSGCRSNLSHRGLAEEAIDEDGGFCGCRRCGSRSTGLLKAPDGRCRRGRHSRRCRRRCRRRSCRSGRWRRSRSRHRCLGRANFRPQLAALLVSHSPH